MEDKGFVAVLLLLGSALFFAGCVQTQPQATPTPPSASPTPPSCTANVYVSCPDGFKYLSQECVNGVLNNVYYLVDPCANHQTPAPTGQPTTSPFPTVMPTASPLPSPSPTSTVTPTVTPGPGGCTQNVTKICPNGRVYLDQLCENGVLTPINYFADPCGVSPSPTACTSNHYVTCPSGKTYLSASCIDGVLYPVSYFMDPCSV